LTSFPVNTSRASSISMRGDDVLSASAACIR
jgi:hypothetical protein